MVPEEKLSLAHGLIEAGAASSIASTWPVDDRATMLLMIRFYELWSGGSISTADALRAAQLWLRDTTDGAFRTYLAAKAGVVSSQNAPPEAVEHLVHALDRTSDSQRSFAHPLAWAGFASFGA